MKTRQFLMIRIFQITVTKDLNLFAQRKKNKDVRRIAEHYFFLHHLMRLRLMRYP